MRWRSVLLACSQGEYCMRILPGQSGLPAMESRVKAAGRLPLPVDVQLAAVRGPDWRFVLGRNVRRDLPAGVALIAQRRDVVPRPFCSKEVGVEVLRGFCEVHLHAIWRRFRWWRIGWSVTSALPVVGIGDSMHKFASVALFALIACGSSSRIDECEVEGCDQAAVDACVQTVEACEDAGVLVDTCVDAAIAVNDIACDADAGDDDTGA